MIQSTFLLLDKVGNTTEKNLWNQDITTWDQFIKKEKIKGFSQKKKIYCDKKLTTYQKALYNNSSQEFLHLPQAETWRLYEWFKEETVFLDIEIDTVQNGGDVTVIGLYNGIDTKTMIAGINLDIKTLKEELQNYKLIVTFNGSIFDIPYLKKRYPDLIPSIPHMDLRVACSRLGYKGGLKEIEKEFGIQRRTVIENFRGGDAYTLWRMYRGSKDPYYLDLLVEYNEEDVINLKKIADKTTKELKNRLLNFNSSS